MFSVPYQLCLGNLDCNIIHSLDASHRDSKKDNKGALKLSHRRNTTQLFVVKKYFHKGGGRSTPGDWIKEVKTVRAVVSKAQKEGSVLLLAVERKKSRKRLEYAKHQQQARERQKRTPEEDVIGRFCEVFIL